MYQSRITQLLFSALLIVLFAVPSFAAIHDEPEQKNWRRESLSTHAEFNQAIQEIALWCRSNGLAAEADETLAMQINRDPERQFIFVPDDYVAAEEAPAEDSKKTEWRTRIRKARSDHAQRIFELAKSAASAGHGTPAFMLLHEAVHYDPDNEQVRNVLGHRKTETGWQVANVRIRAKKATRPHSKMNWPAKSFIVVSSPHFNISSKADEATTIELAEKLERWHNVWRQVFFDYWSRAVIVQRWIDGKGKTRIPDRKFDVIFFENREQYIAELRRSVKGVEVSYGYYDNGAQLSFFYASEENSIRDTWRHEATHQWFQESIRSIEQPFDDGFAWLGEGIAMYFESLDDFGDYVTLGGFDTRRLQFARLRRLREGYKVPLAEASALGRIAFQQRDDVQRLYSQSAGVSHMLMDQDAGKYQSSLTEFLKLMYQGKLKPDTFELLIGSSLSELDNEYEAFLKVDKQEVKQFLAKPADRTELDLAVSNVDQEALRRVGRCINLKWLDLTRNDLRGNLLAELANCDQLEQLFLSGCRVDRSTIESLAGLEKLKELDLSASSVEDSHLDAIARLPALKLLRLTATRVSDAKVKAIANKFPDIDVKKD